MFWIRFGGGEGGVYVWGVKIAEIKLHVPTVPVLEVKSDPGSGSA